MISPPDGVPQFSGRAAFGKAVTGLNSEMGSGRITRSGRRFVMSPCAGTEFLIDCQEWTLVPNIMSQNGKIEPKLEEMFLP